MPRCRAHLRFTDLELAVGKPGVMDGRPHLTCHCRPNFYTSTKLHSLVTKAQQCEWLAQSHWTATVWLAVEPATSWSQVRCPICCATMTHYTVHCDMTNYEMLWWLVKTLSRDIHHYRMLNRVGGSIFCRRFNSQKYWTVTWLQYWTVTLTHIS